MPVSGEVEVEDEDAVVAEYDVYLTDDLRERLMLFQYPNRDRHLPYSEANRCKPSEVRFKAGAGLVEVDIPISVYENFDKEKAIDWGQALRQSELDKAGGSLGLAGGFGVGSAGAGAGARGRTSAAAESADPRPSRAQMLANFPEANARGLVLNKQVLGGMVEPMTDEQPIYMVGAFHDNQLHLSRVDGVVQLRPQFHHIDAALEQERNSAKGQREAAHPARVTEARPVQMAVKAVEAEDLDVSQTMKTLKAIQEEQWTPTDYKDEDSPEAWEAYGKLFMADVEHAPRLRSTMTGAQYLDAVSPPTYQAPVASKSGTTRHSGGRSHKGAGEKSAQAAQKAKENETMHEDEDEGDDDEDDDDDDDEEEEEEDE